MPKKKKKVEVPVFRKDQWRCASWCMDRGIKVYHLPKRYTDDGYYVEVFSNGKTVRSVKYDSIEEASYKIWELYCHIYDNNNK